MKKATTTKAVIKPASLRSTNKEQRRNRVLRAAFDLFAAKGFDQTTMREIAERAGVGLGTLFLYAEDKIDLCLLCLGDELDRLSAKAARSDAGPVAQRVRQFFEDRFMFWGAYPELSRAAAWQMVKIYPEAEPNGEWARGHSRRYFALNTLEKILKDAIKKGELREDSDPENMAVALYWIFLGELRFWLAQKKPEPKSGLKHYMVLANLVLRGHFADPVVRVTKGAKQGVTKRKRVP